MTATTVVVAKSEVKNLSILPSQPEQQVLATDTSVPRLLLMQAMSEAVLEGKAKIGDMVRNTDLVRVGGPDKTVSFIPLRMEQAWLEQEKVGNKFEYRKNTPRTHSNERLEWRFHRNQTGQEFTSAQVGTTEWQRTKVINLYALLLDDVVAYTAEVKKALETGDMPDLTKSLLPVQISFRSMSFRAGQAVNNYYLQYLDMKQYNPNLKSYAYSMPLSCKQEKNDKGTYFIFEVGGAKKLDEALLPTVATWYNRLHSGDVKVDESSPDEESGRATEKSIC